MKIPLKPKHPERICWGCDKLCPAEDLRCGNGSLLAPHPIELFGEEWWKESGEQPDPAEEAILTAW